MKVLVEQRSADFPESVRNDTEDWVMDVSLVVARIEGALWLDTATNAEPYLAVPGSRAKDQAAVLALA